MTQQACVFKTVKCTILDIPTHPVISLLEAEHLLGYEWQAHDDEHRQYKQRNVHDGQVLVADGLAVLPGGQLIRDLKVWMKRYGQTGALLELCCRTYKCVVLWQQDCCPGCLLRAEQI